MQTYVTHTTENDEIVISVVTISTDLTFGIFILTLTLFLFKEYLTFGYFLTIYFFSISFHVFKILFFFRVKLINKFQWIFCRNWHKTFFNFWELNSRKT